MKRYFIALIVLFCSVLPVFAIEDAAKVNGIQARVDSVGTNLLNLNKITKRVVFVYSTKEKRSALSSDKNLTKRTVILYNGLYNHIQTDDELAAMLSRELAVVIKSYSGMASGTVDSAQVALGSKKFETYADKRAVDFMVNAGYNPLALIVYINKTCPQKRFDRFSRHNLTSKRLARIYEYITYKYPKCLEDNEYTQNKYYQNFLLTSINNRKMLEEKIKTHSSEELKYE